MKQENSEIGKKVLTDGLDQKHTERNRQRDRKKFVMIA